MLIAPEALLPVEVPEIILIAPETAALAPVERVRIPLVPLVVVVPVVTLIAPEAAEMAVPETREIAPPGSLAAVAAPPAIMTAPPVSPAPGPLAPPVIEMAPPAPVPAPAPPVIKMAPPTALVAAPAAPLIVSADPAVFAVVLSVIWMVWAFSLAKASVVGKIETVSLVALPINVLPFTVKFVVAVKVVVVVKEPGAVMATGRLTTTAPVVGEEVIWLAVPVTEETPDVKQVAQPISPRAERVTGLVAETATVPVASGKVMVLLGVVGSVMAKVVVKASSVNP